MKKELIEKAISTFGSYPIRPGSLEKYFINNVLEQYIDNAQVTSIEFENKCIPTEKDEEVELLHVSFSLLQSYQHEEINDRLIELEELFGDCSIELMHYNGKYTLQFIKF